MYITSFDELRSALDVRRRQSENVRERHQEFLRRRFGIELNCTNAPRLPDFGNEGKPLAVLARQIASVCMEDVAFELAALPSGCTPVTLTFIRDAFSVSNHDKLHRVDVPWMHYTKSDQPHVTFERLTRESNKELEAVPLKMIRCVSGKSLPSHHKELRRAAMLSGIVYDLSHWHSFMIQNASVRPDFIFRVEAGKEVRVPLSPESRIEPNDRPPSSWYYPYYLSWFLDGTMVLFETYDNPIGEVSHAKKLFEKSMHDIERETGFLPLVVKIPPLSMEMLHCNRHLLWRHDALPRLREEATRVRVDNTVEHFETVARLVTQFR